MTLGTSTAGTDPTDSIATVEDALKVATRLLRSADTNNAHAGLWRLVSSPLLAAILFDVSPAGTGGGGIARARIIAAHPDDSGESGTPNWLTVAGVCPDEHLAKRLRESSNLEVRQREAIRVTLVEALEGDYGEVQP